MVQSAIVLRLGPATFPIRLLFSLPARAIDGPLTPEQSLQYLKTEPGLRVELVAAEPLVVDPVAVASLESTRALLRSLRALQAQAALQQAAAANGIAALALSDVDAGIAAARRARRRK